ncbi:IS21 family transposase [Desulfosporosinus sp. FKA]|uniref:IS21 family transposase n=1 Tax=Desulfosporosinus sp. FKA TaxID=1969834 RepID=UPI000B49C06C|nr:IS21 family transposase [Desulfosporosinus sp. FKA]
MTNYREILRLAGIGLSRTSIGTALGYSRNTVAEVLRRAQVKGIELPLPSDMSDRELQDLLFPEKAKDQNHKMPDCEKMHKELGKSGVTLTLLWEEYCNECRQNGEIPYAFTQFRFHYHRYVQTTKATMHLTHKPGEQLEVDWAGQTASVVDRDTGEKLPAYIFVATLPCSACSYVEAFLSQNQESWISAHIHAFEFFGGIPRILTPDNLKTGVEKSNWYSPTINKSYHELAEHYGCAVIPARVRKPKDKPSVEGAVGVISTWIIAALRNRTFFTLSDLNEAISEKLRAFNEKPFQKKPGSRMSAFLNEEKEFLQPLPKNRYELAIWKKLMCGFNYHISVEKNFYSVPYEYIKHEMDVRVTGTTIEVFYSNHRICSHPRLYGKSGQYHTIPEHMPEKHKSYTEWNAERFISWAKSIGEYTKSAITAILSSHKIEQQGYRACIGVLKLADKYGVKRLEAACEKALSYTPNPSYKNIDSILKSGSDKLKSLNKETKPVDESHSFIRGAEYYGRKK